MDGAKLTDGAGLTDGALEGSCEMLGFGDRDGAALGDLLTKGLVFLILTQVIFPSLIGTGSIGRPLRPFTFSKPMVTLMRALLMSPYRNSMVPSTNERTAWNVYRKSLFPKK